MASSTPGSVSKIIFRDILEFDYALVIKYCTAKSIVGKYCKFVSSSHHEARLGAERVQEQPHRGVLDLLVTRFAQHTTTLRKQLY
jgi:hypothetical protein